MDKFANEVSKFMKIPALKILVLDDEENIRKSLYTFLKMHDYEVETASLPSHAEKMLNSGEFQVLLTDVKMPEINGIQLAEKLREKLPSLTILIMTAYGSVKDAVTAMKRGVYDYLTKPLDQDELLITLQKIAEHHALTTEVRSLRRRLGIESAYEGLVGNSEAMRHIYALIETAAKSCSSVLITGETGTGKDMVVRAIHRNSSRKSGPLVAVSCGALPETLLESELFGHVKGAFTGAISNRAGRIRTANGGTLFLDEIATMSLSAQVRLLRVLEEKEFEPLGSDKTIKVDIRVMAATNENLSKAVEDQRFREDLFYRLNVLHIEMPPLRDHKEDIPLLVRHILKKLEREAMKVSSGAMNLLIRYDWPGNVRELENVIEATLTLVRGDTIVLEHLPRSLGPRDMETATNFKDKVELFERYLIEEKLWQTRGNVTKAAQELNFPLRTLRRKIEKYSLNVKDFKLTRNIHE